jgi:hypothetical protein
LNNYTQDPSLTSFVFSLTNGDKLTDSNTGNSIYSNAAYGPTYGAHVLYICDQSDRVNSSYFTPSANGYKNANYANNL